MKNVFNIPILLLIIGFASLEATYYKCFSLEDDVSSSTKKIALFLEDNYITVMDNIYAQNINFDTSSSDKLGEYSFYKKEESNFIYNAKIYKHSDSSNLTMILIRKNLNDKIMLKDTTYLCTLPQEKDLQDLTIITK